MRVLKTSMPRLGWVKPHCMGKAPRARFRAEGASTGAMSVGRTSPEVTILAPSFSDISMACWNISASFSSLG